MVLQSWLRIEITKEGWYAIKQRNQIKLLLNTDFSLYNHELILLDESTVYHILGRGS